MDKDNYTVISLIDLIAYFVKKFMVLLIGALVGTALLLSFKLASSTSSSNQSGALRILQMQQDFIDEVESNNPVFKEGELFCSKIAINVNSDENVVIDSNGKTLSAIGLEIESFWNNLDVASLVGSTQDSDVLKSAILFKQTGFLTTIVIYSNDRSESERLATAILKEFIALLNSRESSNKISYSSVSTSSASINDVAGMLEQLEAEKTKLQDEMAKVVSNANNSISKKQLIKYAVIGFLFGGVVTVLILGIRFISRNPVTNSFDLEKTLSVPFLGAVFIDKGFLSKLARIMIGERQFKSDDEAESFLKGSFSSKAFISTNECKRIAILSSTNGKDIEKRASKVVELLKSFGFEASFIGDSTDNPATIGTLEKSDAVILLDRQWVSKTNLAKVNKSMADAAGKRILGFVIC